MHTIWLLSPISARPMSVKEAKETEINSDGIMNAWVVIVGEAELASIEFDPQLDLEATHGTKLGGKQWYVALTNPRLKQRFTCACVRIYTHLSVSD